MIAVYAIDALEFNRVEKYDTKNLKQEHYGKTDISEFSQPRTMVLWSSFMTGENKEKEILAKGDKEMWNTRIPLEKTFFSQFDSPKILDLPGYNYDLGVHEKSRKLLKSFFDAKSDAEKERIRKEYNKDAFEHHKTVRKRFLGALGEDRDFVLGYFSVADVVGHLNFGNDLMMKMIYRELDELAAKVRETADRVLVLSDHGMKAIGRFGDHSGYGFWSTNWDAGLDSPRITDMKDSILALK